MTQELGQSPPPAEFGVEFSPERRGCVRVVPDRHAASTGGSVGLVLTAEFRSGEAPIPMTSKKPDPF
jgi:hypothetical protein